MMRALRSVSRRTGELRVEDRAQSLFSYLNIHVLGGLGREYFTACLPWAVSRT